MFSTALIGKLSFCRLIWISWCRPKFTFQVTCSTFHVDVSQIYCVGVITPTLDNYLPPTRQFHLNSSLYCYCCLGFDTYNYLLINIVKKQYVWFVSFFALALDDELLSLVFFVSIILNHPFLVSENLLWLFKQ